MTQEDYAIDPVQFRRTLLHQRRTRMKGGLYHLNQVLMVYSTNRVEGSQLDLEQTRYIYETRTITGDGVPVDDVVETVNSFDPFDEMLSRVDEPVTAEMMQDYHRILKQGTTDARRQSFAAGDWKRRANVAGGRETTPPEEVEAAVQDLLAHASPQMPFEDVAAFHHRFGSIHPFQDGNGRAGRVLMFQQCLRHGIPPFIVLEEKKVFYYRGLSLYQEEPGFLHGTLRPLQDDYYARFSALVEILPGK